MMIKKERWRGGKKRERERERESGESGERRKELGKGWERKQRKRESIRNGSE